MSIVLMEKDPFVDYIQQQVNNETIFNEDFRKSRTRRPLLGTIPRDDFYSWLSVVAEDPHGQVSTVNLLDQGSDTGKTKQWSNFLVQNVQERRMEKAQVVQTFGDSHYFFFGEEPLFLMVSGLLTMAEDYNWANEFRFNYENYFRGSRCAENNARVHLAYDTMILQGFIVSMAMDYNAESPVLVPMSFNMAVTNFFDTSVPARGSLEGDAALTEYTSYTSSSAFAKYSDVKGQFIDEAAEAETLEAVQASLADTLQSEFDQMQEDTHCHGELGRRIEHARGVRTLHGSGTACAAASRAE
tara:strand:- start:2066 stop:2962 length:897 start_codon:yes stop_codon:yes gene_type:complete